MTYFEVSSKTGQNVEQVFYKIAQDINEQQKLMNPRLSSSSQNSRDLRLKAYREDDESIGGQASRVKLGSRRDEKAKGGCRC